jgi:hypothetical protein
MVKVLSDMTPLLNMSEKLRKLLSTLTDMSEIPGNPIYTLPDGFSAGLRVVLCGRFI